MRIEVSELFRVPPERLWPLLANTDSLNRELGLPNVEYAFTPLPQGGASTIARARIGPLRMEWEENPFEWVWGREYSVRRLFRKGPMKDFRASFLFEPDSAGCRVRIGVDLEPAGLVGRMIAGKFGRKSVNDTLAAARHFEQFLLGEIPSPYPNRYGKAQVDQKELEGRLRQLTTLPVDRALTARLGKFVAEEVDERVCDMKPFELAEEWKADRLATLKLCLFATRVGVLDLRWHVICPS